MQEETLLGGGADSRLREAEKYPGRSDERPVGEYG